jgi:mRNA interferase MazF
MVMYVPDKGDLIWLHFDPQAGHEQAGRRPALTISPKSYNQKTGLGIFCPVISQEKGYPFEVKIKDIRIQGVVLSDQIKSMDWKIRNAEFISKVNPEIFNNVLALLKTLI